MNWNEIIDLLGGGPFAIAIVGLVWDRVRLTKRNDDLVDRIIDMSSTTSAAMNDLSRQIEASLRGRT